MNPVLLIDDDKDLCGMLTTYLEPESFKVRAVHDGVEGVRNALSGRYDLVLLDIGLPGLNGFEILKKIRKDCDLPVLILSGRTEDVDRILGLEMGADDYVSKPFQPRELLARMKNIMRRNQQGRTSGPRANTPLRLGDLALNPGTREAEVDDRVLDLTSCEYQMLECLARNAGEVISREVLSKEVLGREFLPYDRSVDMHISHLRQKLGTCRDGGERIRTVRGAGYMLCRRG